MRKILGKDGRASPASLNNTRISNWDRWIRLLATAYTRQRRSAPYDEMTKASARKHVKLAAGIIGATKLRLIVWQDVRAATNTSAGIGHYPHTRSAKNSSRN
jgi:hypothetical protein